MVDNQTIQRDINYKQIVKSKKVTLFFKRIFDIVLSFLGLSVLLIPFIIIGLIIVLTSKGGVFYKQVRVGKNGKEFKIFKFRTMVKDADKKGLQITTKNDSRITKIGKVLRKTKIDELPQLINVLIGNMSFVGPRPEVRKYVDMYNERQKSVLFVKPGITELASIIFKNENEILDNSENAEETYIQEIMPEKIDINLEYIEKMNLFYDIKLIFKTFIEILK